MHTHCKRFCDASALRTGRLILNSGHCVRAQERVTTPPAGAARCRMWTFHRHRSAGPNYARPMQCKQVVPSYRYTVSDYDFRISILSIILRLHCDASNESLSYNDEKVCILSTCKSCPSQLLILHSVTH